MSTLGSIVVRLTMPTAEFDADTKKAAVLAERRAKDIDASFAKAGKAIGIALGAAAVTVMEATRRAINRMDELGKAAARVGESTEGFSKLVYAGDLAGVSMDQLVRHMGRLTKEQAAALNPTSKQAALFKSLGIEVADATGKLRSSRDVLLDFADAFQRSGNSPEMLAAGIRIFGEQFRDLVPLLQGGRDDIEALGDEAERLGLVVSDEAAAAAAQFNDNLTRLKGQVTGMTTQLATGLLPVLLDMGNQFQASSDRAERMRQVGEALGQVAVVAANTLSVFARAASSLGTAFGMAADYGKNLLTITQSVARLDFRGAAGGLSGMLRTTATGGTMLGEEWNRPWMQMPTGLPAAPPRPPPTPITLPTGGGGRSGGRARAAGLSEEEKAAQALQRSYDSLMGSMHQRIELFGKEGEAARVAYEIQHGSLQGLAPALRAEIEARAEKLDAMREEKRLADALKAAQDREVEGILNYKSGIERLLDDLDFERELLGMSNSEREVQIALRNAGVMAGTAEEAMIRRNIEALQDEREAYQVRMMLQDGIANALGDIVTGQKSVADGFRDMLADMASQLARFYAQKAVQQFFEAWAGGSSSGGSGGGWGAFFAALFGGNRANGGPVSGSRLYEVGEGGNPELFRSGNRTFLIPGNDGHVIPAARGGTAPAGGAGQTIVNVHNGSGQPSKVEERMDGMSKIIDVFIGEVDKRIANNGSTGRAISQRFGMNPVGVVRG